jgi:anti-anti-sigma factor
MNETIDDVPFEVVAEQDGRELRLRVSGELDLHREADLRSAFATAFDGTDVDRLVLDVRALQFLDSSGLRALLTCRDRTRAAGVSFVLAVAPGPVTRLLQVAGVVTWFDYE